MNFKIYEEQLDVVDFYIHLTTLKINEIDEILKVIESDINNNVDSHSNSVLYLAYVSIKRERLVNRYVKKYKINTNKLDFDFFNYERNVESERLSKLYAEKESISNNLYGENCKSLVK